LNGRSSFQSIAGSVTPHPGQVESEAEPRLIRREAYRLRRDLGWRREDHSIRQLTVFRVGYSLDDPAI
jgi:DNA-binding winged helix-turn-helix (wHTH) protein